MAILHPKIARMSSEEYKSFCEWLLDYADTNIREFVRMSLVIQQETLERFELEAAS